MVLHTFIYIYTDERFTFWRNLNASLGVFVFSDNFLYNHKLGELENEVASQSAHHVYCARLKASGCHYTQTSDTGLFGTTWPIFRHRLVPAAYTAVFNV